MGVEILALYLSNCAVVSAKCGYVKGIVGLP